MFVCSFSRGYMQDALGEYFREASLAKWRNGSCDNVRRAGGGESFVMDRSCSSIGYSIYVRCLLEDWWMRVCSLAFHHCYTAIYSWHAAENWEVQYREVSNAIYLA